MDGTFLSPTFAAATLKVIAPALTELRVKVNQSEAFCPGALGMGVKPNAPMVLTSVAAETAVPA